MFTGKFIANIPQITQQHSINTSPKIYFAAEANPPQVSLLQIYCINSLTKRENVSDNKIKIENGHFSSSKTTIRLCIREGSYLWPHYDNNFFYLQSRNPIWYRTLKVS